MSLLQFHEIDYFLSGLDVESLFMNDLPPNGKCVFVRSEGEDVFAKCTELRVTFKRHQFGKGRYAILYFEETLCHDHLGYDGIRDNKLFRLGRENPLVAVKANVLQSRFG